MISKEESDFRGYLGKDLVDSFLLCYRDFCFNQVKDVNLYEYVFKSKEKTQPKLNRLLNENPIEMNECFDQYCMEKNLNAQQYETCIQLWMTLKIALTEIEEYSLYHSKKLIPASLNEVWSLIESTQIHRDCEKSESSSKGRSKGRL